ncbi:MAG: trypsin-like peptidase domain-containing protein [Pirellulales bacterium]|nr:trypsin-like peptidase domain-containing protein [Pirellulales bacterium]
MRKVIYLAMLAAPLGVFSAVFWCWSRSAESVSLDQEPGASTHYSTPSAGRPISPTATGPATPADLQGLTPDEQVNVLVYQFANRSVVNIKTKGVQTDRFHLFEVLSKGEGSGLVLDKQGHVLTNYHVIEAAQEVQVTLFDGNTFEARLVGGDPDTDVAVLKIDALPASLFPVKFGSSTRLLVGQRVFAIGNPFGLERTLTTGIISSLNRTLPARNSERRIKSVIQIDADINPGSSGGPLLDSRGRMIGMNTAIASKTGESAGVGFAVPVNTIARVVPQLIANGRVRRPNAGITKLFPVERGLLVALLERGGPAERAGLQGPRIEQRQKRQGPFLVNQRVLNLATADVILKVDGRPVKTPDEFYDVVEEKQPGDQVVLSILRDGQLRQVPLRLGLSGGEK